VRPVGGGNINEAFRVVLFDGREAFVKTRADVPSGEYAAEAAALTWLAEPGALRVPAVLDVADGYLALEWVAPGRLDAAGEEELGRGLAATHADSAPRFGRFSEDEPDGGVSLGSVRLSNAPTDDWPTFYAERRLRPLATLAADNGALSTAAVKAVERLCERIGELVGPPEPPARLHGDLWHGNVLADADGRPWLIDPSAFGAPREPAPAMLALFGPPPVRVLSAYQELTPLADEWEQRVELYQLLPLLVHALLFGGSYSQAAERVALRYR
jgi:fructosamine-3-kinase